MKKPCFELFILIFKFSASSAFRIGTEKTYTNPVLDDNRPDPAALRLGSGDFVAVSTSDLAKADNNDPVFPIIISSDFVTWNQVGYVFPAGKFPKWAYIDMWAPEIRLVNGNYYVYYTGRKRSDDALAIGVAISQNKSNPLGPYKDFGAPIIEGYPGVIDIHYFLDPRTNIPYLVWKHDYNSIGFPSKIFMKRVEADGITFRDEWPRYTLARATEIDDNLVVEGPSIIYRNGFYYLFFSGDGFTANNYHVVVARSKSPTGPYERYVGNYFLHLDEGRFNANKNCTFVAPGGGTAVQVEKSVSDDAYWYIYHAWRYNEVYKEPPGRVLAVDKMKWEDDWPFIGIPSDSPMPAPNLSRKLNNP